MDTARILQTTHWLPWGCLGDVADCAPAFRQRVAGRAAALRRDGAHPHYAWLAALEETARDGDDCGHWGEDEKAVG